MGDDRALRDALAVPGRAFRIGGAGALPVGEGVFETLTSGSSGQPRRILRSMESWIASFAMNAGLFGIGPGIRVAVLGDLVHSLALYGALEGLHLGAEVVLLGGVRPDRQVRALAGAGVIYATPAQLRLLVEAGWQASGLILVGGSKLDAGLRAALSGAEVREFYGAAEASFITLAGPDAPAESVGAVYPGVELDLRAGQIWVRSPYLFQGYAGADAGGAVWDQGWLSVGEMGRLEGGYLYLSGRAGRMVTVADQNVFPEEIESFIAGLPGVARVAVLPRRDALRGAVMVAVVHGDRSAEAAILAACRGRLGALVAPRAVIWVDDWPVLASGKTDLVRLAGEVGL
ncbi:AMP-binding protein [Cypionkella psychrotolerans]|uniref:AMP-binding protein n=1 Tax=Cypionkella psychrotolerans TaxID=1678131 RepID=UPI0006B60CF9|nr:AMP-binding protein [Cypionkella psychrotolerans]